MRIWLAPSSFDPHRGGVEEATLKLALHLQQVGDEVLVITNQHPASLPAVDDVDGIPVRRLPFTLPGRRPDRALRHRLARSALQGQLEQLGAAPDVVHVMCPSSQLEPMRRWAVRNGCPLVITSHGETEMDAGRLYQRSAWMRRELRRGTRDAAALTSCSAWTASAAARVAPEFAGATVVLNGIDTRDWAGTAPLPEAPVVAAWGRLVPQKGFDLLLDAWPLVTAAVPDAQLLLGGDGSEGAALRGRLPARAEALGPLDRRGVRDLLGRARVVVVPSRIEPFGIVALEALAAGRGLVYAAGTGLAEAAGGCGRVADVHDPAALALTIVAELASPTRAAAGTARAGQLTWAVAAAGYRQVYRGALGAPS